MNCSGTTCDSTAASGPQASSVLRQPGGDGGARQPCCRFCGAVLRHTFIDLGMSPLCESYVSAERQDCMEPFYPLHVRVCEQCLLVQLPEYVRAAEIYTEYAYFSSYSTSWVDHARRYVDMVTERFGLNDKSQVVELASNDGYLLQHFVAKGIPVLGIEPAVNIAEAALKKGIPTVARFFGQETAKELASRCRPNLLLGNNVLAHVPDINDFVEGMRILLPPEGIITMEFQHLMRLMDGNQFDTIYHEHYSYLSFLVVERIFSAHGLTIFDVEELGTHGGSLRIFACHDGQRPVGDSVRAIRQMEEQAGFTNLAHYFTFAEQVKQAKWALLEFLIAARRAGKTVAGYGAPGKGNTLLNYCGVRTDLLEYTVDRNPYKHGKFLPGTRIPIFAPERIQETRPDYLLILPWNLKDEIMSQMRSVREWGGRFVVPIPRVEVFD